MRIREWSSDVWSSDLAGTGADLARREWRDVYRRAACERVRSAGPAGADRGLGDRRRRPSYLPARRPRAGLWPRHAGDGRDQCGRPQEGSAGQHARRRGELMDRAEATGLGVAVAGHLALLAALSLGLASVTRPMMQSDPIQVSFVDEVGLQAAVTEAQMEDPAEAMAPELGPMEEAAPTRSEEHTSEHQSLMRTSYAVFCLKKKSKR